jgi:hypothetical protein
MQFFTKKTTIKSVRQLVVIATDFFIKKKNKIFVRNKKNKSNG